jgi:hypothetical protein
VLKRMALLSFSKSTFKFDRLLPEVAGRCLEAPIISSGYEFNFAHGRAAILAARLLPGVLAEHE